MNEHRRLVPDLDAATVAQLEALASARGVTGAALAGDVLREFADSEAEALRRCELGRAQIARGEYVTHEQVVANLRQWIETRERPR